MNWLEQLLSPALVRALGWTLVHSLWQGAVVALALAGLLLLLRRHQATIRYNVAGVALAALLVLASFTFGRYYYAARIAEHTGSATTVSEVAAGTLVAANAAVLPAEAALPAVGATPAGPLQAWLTYFEQNMPLLVAIWLLGLLAMTLRLLGGIAYVQRLRQYRVQPLADEWQERLARLAERAGLQRSITLLESALVKVPVVVGHLRPVILLPLGTVSGLSQGHLEAILAHELAHVARRDYLVNLLQSVAETLFFYHPAVWFITACLRTERENCCDDAATALVGGNPLTLARALAALAELSADPSLAPRLAMSAVGPDGSLLGRIKRLVQGRGTPTFSEGFMAACVVLVGLVLLSTAVALADPSPRPDKSGRVGDLSRLPFLTPDDTTKKDKSLAAFTPAPLDPLAPLDIEAPVEATEPEEALLEAEVPEEPALVEHLAESTAALTDDDKKKKRKDKRAQATERVVVVGGARRGGPGTVVIEKDKKGRLTELYVNGERVEGATAASKNKGKKGDSRTEVIRVAPNGWSRGNSEMFRYNFDNDFARRFRFQVNPGWSKEDAARIRRDVQRQLEASRHQLLTTPDGRNFSFQWRNEDGRNYQEIARRALEQAERSLRDAERTARTEEERSEIREQRERLQEQLEEQRAHLRDAEAHRETLHEAEITRHEAEITRREAEATRREADKTRRATNSIEKAIVDELVKDGLITDRRNFSFTLRNSGMTVNGKKQSAATLKKYLSLHEQRAGRKLSSTGSYSIQQNSSESSESSTRLSEPPRPPRAPRAPRGPMPPAAPSLPPAPAMPAPPAPPTIDSGRIREELRKDGLLGKDEKSFQLQLNDSGLRVNGQAQSAEMTAKYRRLLDVAASPDGSKGSRSVQISVSE